MAKTDELTTVDAIVQLSFVVQQKLQRRAAAHDLSMIQIRLLGVLRDRHPTMKELGVLLDLDKSSISGLVDRAEQRGLVSRAPDEADRRAMRVSLTPLGRRIIAAGSAEVNADIAEFLAPLSPAQQRTLTSLLARVLVE
ncbi:MarR family winged helix-turn-helix transcriptional regulator [Gordonia sp. NPDC003424]